MQGYYQLTCERQQQALRRNQALQNDTRHASTFTTVDTSRLETLKSHYHSSVARAYPPWLAQVNSHKEGGTLPSAKDTPQSTGALSPQFQSQLSIHPQLLMTLLPSPHSMATQVSNGITSTTMSYSMAVSSQEDTVHVLSPQGPHQTQPLQRHIVPHVSVTTHSLVSTRSTASLFSEPVLSSMPSFNHSESVPTCTFLPQTSSKSLPHLHNWQPDSLVPPAFLSPHASPAGIQTPKDRSSLPTSQPTRARECPRTNSTSAAISQGTENAHGYQPSLEREGGSHQISTPSIPVVTDSEVIMSQSSSSGEKIPTLSIDTQASRAALPSTNNCAASTTRKSQVTGVAVSADAATILTVLQPVSTTVLATTPANPKSEACPLSHSFLPTSITLSHATFPCHSQQPLNDSPPTIASNTHPQNIVILSREGSESSLSLTPPLDITEDSKQQGSTSGGSSGVSGEPSLKSLPLGGNNNVPCLNTKSEQAQVYLKDLQSTSKHTSSDAQGDNNGLKETIMVGNEHMVAERPIKAEVVCDHTTDVVAEKEHDSLDRSNESSTSDVPLPLTTPSHPVPSVATDAAATNSVMVGMDGSSNDSEGEAHDKQTTDTEDQSPEEIPQLPPNQNGKDAYASFLHSVCQTTATTMELLDSDSEGIEDIVAGHNKGLQESDLPTHTSPSSRPTDATAAVTEGRDEKHLSPPLSSSSPLKNQQVKSRDEKEKGDTFFDASESSQSPHKPAYVPTAMEKEQNTHSKVLQKRLGFWDSDSSVEDPEIESPNGDDDQGDFDFYM